LTFYHKLAHVFPSIASIVVKLAMTLKVATYTALPE